MTKSRLQPLIFDTYQPSGEALRKELTRIMRASRYSRAQIADRMSEAIEPGCTLEEGQPRPVTESMLYAFTSAHGRHSRFPLELAVPFCLAVENFELLSFVLGPHAERVLQVPREGKGRAPEKAKRRKA